MMKASLACAALVLSAFAAHAADASQAVQTVTTAASAPAQVAAASAPAMICHRETPIGSMFSQKVCRPADQDADGKLTDDARRRIQYEAGAAAQQRVPGR